MSDRNRKGWTVLLVADAMVTGAHHYADSTYMALDYLSCAAATERLRYPVVAKSAMTVNEHGEAAQGQVASPGVLAAEYAIVREVLSMLRETFATVPDGVRDLATARVWAREQLATLRRLLDETDAGLDDGERLFANAALIAHAATMYADAAGAIEMDENTTKDDSAATDSLRRPLMPSRHAHNADAEMCTEVPISGDHPLVGTWQAEDQDSSAVFTVSVNEGRLVVTGKDEMNNEPFGIHDAFWDGEVLRFTSLMPSTGHRARHAFRVRADGTVSHELTLTEIWTKRDDHNINR